jgi:WD repeat-containing protein 35
MYVLAALEVEAHREAALGAAAAPGAPGAPAGGGAAAAAEALAGLLGGGGGGSCGGAGARGLDGAWRSAEAYHFWLLAHRQLYSGRVRRAAS